MSSAATVDPASLDLLQCWLQATFRVCIEVVKALLADDEVEPAYFDLVVERDCRNAGGHELDRIADGTSSSAQDVDTVDKRERLETRDDAFWVSPYLGQRVDIAAQIASDRTAILFVSCGQQATSLRTREPELLSLPRHHGGALRASRRP